VGSDTDPAAAASAASSYTPPAAAPGEQSALERPEVQAGIAFAGAFVIARIFNRLVG